METIKGYARYAADLKYTSNGKAIATIILYDTDDGAFETKQRVIAWENLAEVCNRNLTSGDLLYVKGYWKTREWTDREGKQQSVRELTAKQIWLEVGDKPIDILEMEAH